MDIDPTCSEYLLILPLNSLVGNSAEKNEYESKAERESLYSIEEEIGIIPTYTGFFKVTSRLKFFPVPSGYVSPITRHSVRGNNTGFNKNEFFEIPKTKSSTRASNVGIPASTDQKNFVTKKPHLIQHGTAFFNLSWQQNSSFIYSYLSHIKWFASLFLQ
ncbi:hypothetical protein DOM21_03690 [Bacteriovorax stolpii]|nr:hypothetical protein DOM21_03690 [Bacteriovorax stolpii]